MSRKQRLELIRIIIGLAVFAAGWCVPDTLCSGWAARGVFAVAYVIAGWDVLWASIRNILREDGKPRKRTLPGSLHTALPCRRAACTRLLFARIQRQPNPQRHNQHRQQYAEPEGRFSVAQYILDPRAGIPFSKGEGRTAYPPPAAGKGEQRGGIGPLDPLPHPLHHRR